MSTDCTDLRGLAGEKVLSTDCTDLHGLENENCEGRLKMELACEDKTFAIIGCCMEVHKILGAGYLEAVYQEALALELSSAGVPFEREKGIDITYKGQLLKKKYFADFLCFGEVIVETKALAALLPEHQAQVLNYLKATGKKVGLLVNFGTSSLQWKRLVF